MDENKNERDMIYHIYYCMAVQPTVYNIDYNTGVSFNNGKLSRLYEEDFTLENKLNAFEKYLETVDGTLTIIRKQFPDKNWYLFENKLTLYCEMNPNKNDVFVAMLNQ